MATKCGSAVQCQNYVRTTTVRKAADIFFRLHFLWRSHTNEYISAASTDIDKASSFVPFITPLATSAEKRIYLYVAFSLGLSTANFSAPHPNLPITMEAVQFSIYGDICHTKWLFLRQEWAIQVLGAHPFFSTPTL